MHPQEDVITLQALLDLKRGNIRDPQARIYGKENEILHIFTAPIPIPRPEFRGRSNGVARGIYAFQFLIRERGLGQWNGSPFGRLQIAGDIFSHEFSLHAKPDETLAKWGRWV